MKTVWMEARKAFRAAPMQKEVRPISKGEVFEATEEFAEMARGQKLAKDAENPKQKAEPKAEAPKAEPAKPADSSEKPKPTPGRPDNAKV